MIQAAFNLNNKPVAKNLSVTANLSLAVMDNFHLVSCLVISGVTLLRIN